MKTRYAVAEWISAKLKRRHDIGFILFFVGLGIIVLSQGSTTGAFIGVVPGLGLLFNLFPAIGLVFCLGGLIFMSGDLEDKLDLETKSFKRKWEKIHHEKLTNIQAKVKYGEVLKSYTKAVREGKVKQPPKNQPLKYLEEYIRSHK